MHVKDGQELQRVLNYLSKKNHKLKQPELFAKSRLIYPEKQSGILDITG